MHHREGFTQEADCFTPLASILPSSAYKKQDKTQNFSPYCMNYSIISTKTRDINAWIADYYIYIAPPPMRPFCFQAQKWGQRSKETCLHLEYFVVKEGHRGGLEEELYNQPPLL